MATQTITSPPGYGKVVAFDKGLHGHLGLPEHASYRWCANLNAVQLHAQELSKAALSHPLAFARLGDKGPFVPVAVLGLRDGENLSVDHQGQWQSGSYIPAYVRCHPFFVARAKDTEGKPQGLICVQEDHLVKGRPALFDPQGKATSHWQPVQTLLDAAETASAQTQAFVQRLSSLDLMEPFEAIVMPKNGEQLRLKGLWRVSETRLATLPASLLRTLIKQGELRAIHAHLLSLEHFARLMILAAAKTDSAAE